MEKIGRQVFLYDFYGELLTAHQKSVYEDVVLNDMSFSEIAAERGISRQAAHDLIKRCDKILNGYEEKLQLVERFLKTREDVNRIQNLALQCCRHERQGETVSSARGMQTLEEIVSITNRILEEL